MFTKPHNPLPRSSVLFKTQGGSCHVVTEGGAQQSYGSYRSPTRPLRAHLARKRGEGFAFVMTGLMLAACSAQTNESPAVPEAPKVEREATPEMPPMPKSLTIEDIDFNDYSKALAKWSGLKEGQSRGEAVDNIRLYFAPESGDSIISTSQSIFEREDGAVLVFSAKGLPDDAVKAEEIYLIVSGPKGSQTLAAYGSRIKCHRGENTTEWQTALCP